MANVPISQIPNGQAIANVSAAASYTIDGGVIGSVTPKAGTFTTLTTTSISTTSLSATTVSAATPILVSNGGTGLATLTANNVILGAGTSTPTFVAPGASGNLLTSNGTTWTSATPGASSAGAQILLSTLTASDSATIDFTSGIDGTYKEYIIDIIDLVAASDGQIVNLTLSTNGGSNYLGANYQYVLLQNRSGAATPNGSGSTSEAYIALHAASSLGNAAGENFSSRIVINNPASAAVYKTINMASVFFDTSTELCQARGCGTYTGATTAINAFRISLSSGNIASGTFKLYGVL